MNLSPDLERECWRINLGIMRQLEEHAEVAKIETTVLCMDLTAHINRSLGQIKRRALERMRRG